MSAKAKANAGNPGTRRTTKTRAGRWLEDHRQQIAEAAYYRAEQRGFAPGGEQEDWLWAEQEVRAQERRRAH